MWTDYVPYQDSLLLWNESWPRRTLPLGIYDVPERAPGRAEKAFDLGPLLRRGIALRDEAVAEPCRFGPQSGVLCQLIFAEMVELRLQGGEAAIEISGWMRFALAVDDPPIEFPASRLMDIKSSDDTRRMPE